MATVVFLHAHPDDEAIATGGTMTSLVEDGHRVVLVLATRGEVGEVPDGFLAEGETLTERRVREVHEAADLLGVHRVAFLGYRDSGMMGDPTNDEPGSFWTAPVEEAADRLLGLLDGESPDLLVGYDEIGQYGHPDHLQVHRVGRTVAGRLGVRLVESTINREQLARGLATLRPEEVPDLDGVGMPESRIHLAVDVRPWLERKRAAMRAHASQIADDSFFLALGPDAFADVFGTEWYIRHGEPVRVGPFGTSVLDL
jgi:LmbE family N-acetylglucosaminyl deacetylase